MKGLVYLETLSALIWVDNTSFCFFRVIKFQAVRIFTLDKSFSIKLVCPILNVRFPVLLFETEKVIQVTDRISSPLCDKRWTL